MKIFVINHTQIFVELTNVCVWIWIADKHLQFLRTKHLQSGCNFTHCPALRTEPLELHLFCFMTRTWSIFYLPNYLATRLRVHVYPAGSIFLAHFHEGPHFSHPARVSYRSTKSSTPKYEKCL